MRIAGFETHPACDLFPIMTEHELEELARDIREHGLRCPIVGRWGPTEALVARGPRRGLAPALDADGDRAHRS